MKNKITFSWLDKEGIPEKPKNLRIESFQKEPLKRFGVSLNTTVTSAEHLDKLAETLYHISLEMKKTPEKLRKRIEKRTVPSNDSNIEIGDKRRLFLMEILEWCKGDQEKLLGKLREYNFVFLDSLSLMDKFPDLPISKIKLKKYQWMLKVVKWSANPQNDIYDPYVVFGVQILPRLGPKIVIYLNKQFYGSQYFHIKKQRKRVKPKEVQLIKYPDWMTYEERNKWGKEHRRLITNRKMKPSRFYEIHNQDIIVKGELILPDINNGTWVFEDS